ncbi:hypothetical protein KAT60_02095 [Candidatus Woesebacteria bacterium]|nr:hypothetical protein [Candidatus Woesebacteria bacterium]
MEKIAQIDIGKEFGSPFGKDYGLADLVSIILSNALVVAGIILLFLLIFGGISMIMGAGQDNPEAAAKGKQAATSAVIGFIIIFAAYWIIQIIETVTGLNILEPGF